MSNKLSFSQLSKYTQCAKSYDYHYNQRIRETTTTAALSFGSAIDDALNTLLKDLKKGDLKDLSVYKAAFYERWAWCEVNKEKYDTATCTLIGYAESDFQEELLDEFDRGALRQRFKDLKLDPNLPEDLSDLKKELDHRKSIRAVVPFKEEEHQFLNNMNYLSLRRKGALMVEAYMRDIVPQIEEVIDVQKKVELTSDTDDTMIGYVDAVVRLKGHDGIIIMDNKTASKPYEVSNVFYSQQLGIYSYILDAKKAAFAVMVKNVRMNRTKVCSKCKHNGTGSRAKTCDNTIEGKRCGAEWTETLNPSVDTQLIVDDIPEMNQNLIVDNISEINHAIHAKVFPRNLNACQNMYGKPCPYIRLCWKNKMDGLVKLPETE